MGLESQVDNWSDMAIAEPGSELVDLDLRA